MSLTFKTCLRTFATSAVQNKLVKSPLQLFSVDGKYATALYSAATKEKQLDAVEKDIIKFQGILKKDITLTEFLLNPVVKKDIKAKALTDVSKKLSFAAVSTNLLTVLAENGRLKNFNGIANSFSLIMSAHRGDLLCEVISAKPLDEATKSELKPALQKFTKKGENVIVSYKTDPTIIGGLIVSIGDRYVDMSIASKVKKYSDLLKATV